MIVPNWQYEAFKRWFVGPRPGHETPEDRRRNRRAYA